MPAMEVAPAPARPSAPLLLPDAVAAPQRLVSLDAFRGLTIVGMILVNNPGTWGAIYAPLRHAAWHGWTPTDLIFPFFLFIVGVSIVLAFDRALEKGQARGTLARKAGGRALWLFAFGLLMAAWPFFTFSDGTVALRDLSTLRIPGVLQRIAVCYLAAALLYLYAPRRTRHLVLWGLLVLYTLALLFVPVPGLGRPEIEFKGSTLPAWVDRHTLGMGHLWAGADPPRTWDPEGVLSTFPAIATTLFGLWAGERLRRDGPGERKALHLLLAGAGLVTLGYVWSLALPINKSLWTSSYAVFTAGQAMCALGACYWLIDLKGHTRWAAPFVTYGINAITVFVMSGIVAKLLGAIRVPGGETGAGIPLQKAIYDGVFAPLGPDQFTSLLYALVWITAWYGVLRWMQRRGAVIRV